MEVTGPFCRTCGIVRAPLSPGEERLPPCPECGDLASEYRASGTVTAHASVTASYRVTGGNTAANRRDALRAAIDDADSAASSGRAGDAVTAVKRALEAIHELQDCANPAKRSPIEWTHAGWTAAQTERWNGLIGARNAAHHESASVVELHGDSEVPGHVLRWAPTIPTLHSNNQQNAYAAVIAGHAAMAQLRAVLADVTAAIP